MSVNCVSNFFFSRIFPTYVTVMLIFVFVLPYIGNGPLWKLIVYPEAEFCRKNWWTNILFINNYVNTYEMVILIKYISLVIYSILSST